MKNQDIIKCLKNNKSISDYQLISTEKDSRELFYVLDHLEINRAVKTTTNVATIYVSDKSSTGSSVVTITSGDDEKSLNKKIKDAVKKTKEAKNPYYPLPDKQESVLEKESKKYDLNQIANNVAKAVYKANKFENGWLNSTEIFVSNVKSKFFDSKGTKHITNGFEIAIEVIPTWSNNGEEVELYKYYETSSINYDEITKEIEELLLNAQERSIAKTLKDVKLPKNIKVLVKNDMLQEIIYNIAQNTNYRSLYFKENHYNKNDVVLSEGISLTLKPVVKGCSKSMKVDNNGIVLKSTKLIKDGKVDKLWGDNRFAYYLNKKATGNLPVSELDGPRYDYSKEKYLLIENFSAPQLEETNGYWGGEVRLAKYFDGKKYIPLTGFSISGNIYEDLKSVKLSKEDATLPDYKGPKYLIFTDIQIH